MSVRKISPNAHDPSRMSSCSTGVSLHPVRKACTKLDQRQREQKQFVDDCCGPAYHNADVVSKCGGIRTCSEIESVK